MKLTGKGEKLLGAIIGSEFDVASNKTIFKGEQIISHSNFNFDKSKEAISFSIGLMGLTPKKGTFASLGHIFDFNGLVDNKNLPKEQTTKTSSEVPTSFELQNYPNPFNPTTTISYTLPEDGKVLINVYDIQGREVATLLDGFSSAGKHSIIWNGNNISSGIYFYTITFKNRTLYEKMLLMK